MKILHIIPQLSSGGAERFTVDLCNELAEENDVTLVVLHSLKKGQAFYLPQVSSKVKVVSMNKRMGLDLLLPYRLYRLARTVKPDVIHTHLRSIVYSFLVILCFHKSAKCFHTIHSDAKREAGMYVSCWIRKVFFTKKIVVPVTISKESQKSFVKFYGLNAPLIFNGRNIPVNFQPSKDVLDEINKIRPISKTRIIVQLARFNSVKRQSMMARISHRLFNEGYDFCVLMIGLTDKTELKAVKQVSSPVVYILGERQNPLEYLAAADAFALCSIHEGLPISLIEALGVGTIPICTPVGGIVDVIKSGENGFLSNDLSEESYYQVLKLFLETQEERLDVIKSNVRKSYSPFNMVNCSCQYEKLYRGIIYEN